MGEGSGKPGRSGGFPECRSPMEQRDEARDSYSHQADAFIVAIADFCPIQFTCEAGELSRPPSPS